MSIECRFCKHKLSTSYNLRKHQKTARYCLKLQNKKNDIVFGCDYCSSSFTQYIDLERHETKCIKKMEKMEKMVSNLTSDLKNKKELIESLQKQLSNLQKQLIKAATRPITVNKQQNNKIQQINNFQPITDKHLQDHVNNLTIEHIKAGPSGYAKYALDYPLKDNIVCTDFSRRKIKYKNNDGQIITDPEMVSLSKKLFSAIRDRNSELIKEYSKELQEKFWGIPNEVGNNLEEKEIEDLNERMNEVGNVLFAIMSQDRQVRELADGVRSEMYHEFIRHVCSACV